MPTEIDTAVTEIFNDVFNRIKETPKEKALTGKGSFSAELLSEVINITKEKIKETKERLAQVKDEQTNRQAAMGKLDYHFQSFILEIEQRGIDFRGEFCYNS